MSDRRFRRRQPVVPDADAIRDEVDDRIEEAHDDRTRTRVQPQPVDAPVAGDSDGGEPDRVAPSPTDLPADLIAPIPPPEPASAQPGPVTAETPFRQIGDLSRAVWRQVLRDAGSPLLPHVDDIIATTKGYGALALAQAYKESSLAKNAPAGTHNPLGLLDYTGTRPVKMVSYQGNRLPFLIFDSWASAFAEFRQRLADPHYKGGVYSPLELSLEGFIATYVGGPSCWSSRGATCANGETWRPGGGRDAGSINLYLHQTIDRINHWREMGDVPTPAPAPEPPAPPIETDPYRILMGGDYPPVTYGFLADVGLDFYGYGVGHGTQRSTQHTGDDIAVACGTPLYAPAAGVVDCVGTAGTPRWGQSCGAYGDDGGGKGNLTILLDPGEVKLTLGHVRDVFVRPGDRVQAGQQVATVGTMRGCHVHVETSMQRNGTYWLVDPKPALAALVQATPPDPHAGMRHWDIPGTPNGIWLPEDITVHVLLTPKGPNRQGLPLTPDGTVYHQTGNRGVGTDARHHAQWQHDGTEGHPNNTPGGPNIGVHAYTGDRQAWITLPWNEQGIHSGDDRNRTKLAFEECIHADRDAALTERTTAALHAAALRDVIATDEVSPHRCNHCPTIICSSGRWEQTEDTILDLAGAEGIPVPPLPVYAEPAPLPIAWDGEDKVINGIRFVALRRVFRAAADKVPALQYANPEAAPVRRPLPRGEGFEGHWLVEGDDGRTWIITRWWSRIPADLCVPKVALTELPETDIPRIDVELERVA